MADAPEKNGFGSKQVPLMFPARAFCSCYGLTLDTKTWVLAPTILYEKLWRAFRVWRQATIWCFLVRCLYVAVTHDASYGSG